jgi:hypothetical protein
MNRIALKKLKAALLAEFSNISSHEKDNKLTYETIPRSKFNEVSILSDWSDEKDENIAKNCEFIAWRSMIRSSFNEVVDSNEETNPWYS